MSDLWTPGEDIWSQRIRRNLAYSWPLASGGAVDLKGQSFRGAPVLDLTNNNTVTRAAGPSGALPDAASLASASTQYFSRAHSEHIDPNPPAVTGIAQPFAITVWAFPSTVGTTMGVANSRSSGNKWTIQRTSGNRFSVTVWDAAGSAVTSTSSLAISGSTWYFVVAGWDGSHAFCEVNRSTRVRTACVGVNLANNTLIIGGNTGVPANPWNGRLAQFNLWIGRVPTEAELTYLYNNGVGRNLSGKP